MRNSTDLQVLLPAIANDDMAAYKQLYEHFFPGLVKFAFSFLHSGELAEEVVSDVFIKIWLKRKALTRIKNLQLYLYVSTKNLCIDQIRKQKRHQTISLDITQEPADLSTGSTPDSILQRKELLARMHQAIIELPPQCGLVYKLIKEDGLKYREVAYLLGISQKTVENHMTIAMRKIINAISMHLPAKKQPASGRN